jgi:hypothetical protein
MSVKINKNRYNLITLLYLVFVCLSVLNVPTSLFQNNRHVIKTYLNQEKLINQELNSNLLLIEKLPSDSINQDYMDMYVSSRRVYRVLDSVDEQINFKLTNESSSIDKEFNSRRKIEGYFQNDGLLTIIKNTIFDYAKKIRSNTIIYDTSIIDQIPIYENVSLISGKELDWDRYLFLHKPLGISYVQLKRLKVLFLQEELHYQKLLLTSFNNDNKSPYNTADINIVNEKNDNTYLSLNNKTSTTYDLNKSNNISSNFTSNNFSLNNVINTNNSAKVNNDSIINKQKQLEAILASIKVDKLYAGVENTILNEYATQQLNDIDIAVFSKEDVIKINNNKFIFPKSGIYTIRFTNNEAKGKALIFEKQLRVYSLPDPIISLNIKNLHSGVVTKKALINSARLFVSIPNTDYENFPGRINGYRCVRYNINNEKETVYNYGENFQSSLLLLLAKVQKGDILVFDNVTISLNDGSTRTTSPIIYKITE